MRITANYLSLNQPFVMHMRTNNQILLVEKLHSHWSNLGAFIPDYLPVGSKLPSVSSSVSALLCQLHRNMAPDLWKYTNMNTSLHFKIHLNQNKSTTETIKTVIPTLQKRMKYIIVLLTHVVFVRTFISRFPFSCSTFGTWNDFAHCS